MAIRTRTSARCAAIALVFLTAVSGTCPAAEPSAPASPGEGYAFIGTVRPRAASEIESSTHGFGAETMGRDYTIYRNWRKYLGPLGAKKARIQSGWAKTEQVKGKYSWDWLDAIVPDMVAQGVEPWVCLCYGNPIYPGGGGTGLGGGLPSTPESKKAWEAFVAAFVERYRAHVDEWEIWNEPRGGGKAVPAYADLVVRTATLIRTLQPKAQILVAAGGSFDTGFVDALLKLLQEQGKLGLVDAVIYHPYSYNPDDVYGRVAQLRKIVAKYSETISIRQGENGAPSRRGTFGALSNYDWDEERQAKWALRRLLGDLGRDIPSSYFAICDMAYRVTTKGRDSDFRESEEKLKLKINYKGLLAINNDRTVHHAKQGYQAVQHLTALFDGSLTRIKDFSAQIGDDPVVSGHSVFGYRTADSQPVVTVWRSVAPPGKNAKVERSKLYVAGMSFKAPVWIDLRTGRVHAIDARLWAADAKGTTFAQLPVYDSPVVLAERDWLEKTKRLQP